MYQPLASTGQEYNQAPSEADGSHCFTSLTFVHGMCPTMYSESIFTHAFPLCSCHKNFMKLLSHWNKVFGASWPVFWQLGMLGVIWEEGTSLEAIPPPHWLMGEPVASSWLATDVGGHTLQYVVFSQCIRKQGEEPWCLPLLSPMMDYKLKGESNPFLSKMFLVQEFYHSDRGPKMVG